MLRLHRTDIYKFKNPPMKEPFKPFTVGDILYQKNKQYYYHECGCITYQNPDSTKHFCSKCNLEIEGDDPSISIKN